MVIETLIICVTLYVIFGDYFKARAEMLHELAREKEIENTHKEREYDELA